MSQNDKPKLDELQKLLRRLERVELEKAEQRATGEAAAAVGTVPATQDTTGAMPTKPDGASPAEGQQVGGTHSNGANGARLGPASTEAGSSVDEAAGKPGARGFVAKQQPGLETPGTTNPGGGEAGITQTDEKKANENQVGGPQATAPLATAPQATGIGTNATGPRNNRHDASGLKAAESAAAAVEPAGDGPRAGSQKAGPEGGEKQHLARMVYRGTARDIPLADEQPAGERASQRFPQTPPGTVSPGALPNALPDQSPFQLPAIPDNRSRHITDTADEKPRSGSSIGVVLVAAITAAVVSTVAAVLITIWIIRGGGFGGQFDPVLTASRNTPPVAEAGGTTIAKADAISATNAASSPSTPSASASEPPSADAPPEGARTSAGEASLPAGDNKASASAGLAEPANAAVSAQSIAAAIASDESAQEQSAPQPETDAVTAAAAVEDPDREAKGETSETSESAADTVDLAAITNTAPESDKSERVSAQTESDRQPGPATEADPQRDGDPAAFADGTPETLAATGVVEANQSVAPAESDTPAPKLAADTSTQLQAPFQPSEQQADQQAEPAGEALATDAPGAEAPAISNADQAASSLNPDRQATEIAATDPALGRGNALAFNDSRATPPAEDTTAFSAPEPRAPYELNAPTQLEVTPDVSFEFPLQIEAQTGSLDKHFLIVSGLKRGARFSQGVELMFDTWQVRADKIDELRLTVPKGFARELPLTIELRRPDGMSVVRANLLLTAPGSAERLGLPEALYEQEASALPDSVLAKVRQGERAIDNGNLRGARLALQEAALQTSAVAALLLAMSYDPRHVDKFGTASGNDTDVAAARQWYGRASSFGADIATTLARGL